MFRIILLTMVFSASFNLAYAETPMPRTHPTKAFEKEKAEKKEQSVKLKRDIQNIESQLGKTRKDMINVASKMKKNEQDLLDMERQILSKQQEKMDIETRLSQDQGSLSDLILALERIKRVPPQALLLKPEKPLETAQSAMILESVLPSLYERAAQLKEDQEKLSILIAEMQTKENKIISASKDLNRQEQKLRGLLSKRERLLASKSQDYKRKQNEMAQISSQSKSLRDLVRRIEKKQERINKQIKFSQESRNTATEASFTQKTPLPQIGKPQLPVSGLITTSYGRNDDLGAKSQGLTIQTRNNAVVVAPMGGVIEYAGSFRNYGNIALIRHQSNYISLVAGVSRLNVKVGQEVRSGEPIGRVLTAQSRKNIGDGQNTTLYYELRYKGKPVNPSKKISGLR
ncbi:MAG: peptidoglycan DD-metalloendopeptidase family protein [Pseudomonadota bacterium]